MPPAQSVVHAAALLDKGAQLWYEQLVRHVHRLGSEGLPDWDIFCKEMKTRWEPINSNLAAREDLSELRQRVLVAAYCDLFSQMYLRVDSTTDPEAISLFSRDLKEKVRVEVGMKTPTTLMEAMEIAERYDSLTWSVTSSRDYMHRRNGFHHSSGRYDQAVPKEIGVANVNRRPQRNPPRGPAIGNRTPLVCYNCGEPGSTTYSPPAASACLECPTSPAGKAPEACQGWSAPALFRINQMETWDSRHGLRYTSTHDRLLGVLNTHGNERLQT